MLLFELRRGVGNQIGGLHTKANECLPGLFILAKLCKDVGCAGQGDIHVTIILFNLLLRVAGRRIVCHGTAHHYDIRIGRAGYGLSMHVICTNDVYHGNTIEGAQSHRATDEHHICSAQASHLGYGISHLSRGAVGYEPYGVYVLPCRACRDENPQSRHVVRTCCMEENTLHEQLLRRQLAASCVTTCQASLCRHHNIVAVCLKF